jgi:hypothetical protein
VLGDVAGQHRRRDHTDSGDRAFAAALRHRPCLRDRRSRDDHGGDRGRTIHDWGRGTHREHAVSLALPLRNLSAPIDILTMRDGHTTPTPSQLLRSRSLANALASHVHFALYEVIS